MMYSSNDLPERQLCIKAAIAVENAANTDRSLHKVREDISHQLSYKILDNGDIFSTSLMERHGQPYLQFRLDCIILTTQELLDIQRDAYIKGLSERL